MRVNSTVPRQFVPRSHEADRLHETDVSRRAALKRLGVVALACCGLLGAASGCASTKGKKENKTVDDFLQADKPQW